MINASISEKVLTIGEDPKSGKGGIASVIDTYSDNFSFFKFIPTYRPHKFKLQGVPFFIKSLLTLIFTLLRDKKIRIVHIHGAAKGSFIRKFIIYLVCAYLFKKKIIYHVHGSEYKDFFYSSPQVIRRQVSLFLRDADLVICLSKQWERFFREITQSNVYVLENIVSQPHGYEKKRQSNHLKFLFLGAIGNRKGVFDLLEVLANNRAVLKGKLSLTIGGNGETKRLLDFISNNKLEDFIHFVGWVSGEEKRKLLRGCDVFILPSYNEGLPISILEAMSHQLPIISTTVGGIPEIVRENVNGFLIQPGDKVALLNKILKFIENPDLIDKLGCASSKFVEPYYVHNVIPRLELVYRKLLADVN